MPLIPEHCYEVDAPSATNRVLSVEIVKKGLEKWYKELVSPSVLPW